MKFLQDFYLVDWQFFVVCGNKFLWLELAEISANFCGFLSSSETSAKKEM